MLCVHSVQSLSFYTLQILSCALVQHLYHQARSKDDQQFAPQHLSFTYLSRLQGYSNHPSL